MSAGSSVVPNSTCGRLWGSLVPHLGPWKGNLRIIVALRWRRNRRIFLRSAKRPWQSGSNENTNGLLRQYFPKGTDLSMHSQAYLNKVARQLNERPRRPCNLKPHQRDLTPVLHRPVEPAPYERTSSHRSGMSETCQNRKSRTFWQSHFLREHTNRHKSTQRPVLSRPGDVP
jgi:hypothetical protein